MPVSQLLTTVGRSPALVSPVIYFNNLEVPWGTSSGTTVTSYTFPNATTNTVYDFDGFNYIISDSLGSIGDFYLNIWFYPASTNCVIMSEFDAPTESAGYHYTMLEIGGGAVRARTWDMASPWLTSATSAGLNSWNHIYLSYTASTISLELNGATAVTGSVSRSAPTNTYLGVGVSDSTNMIATGRFSGYLDSVVMSTTTPGSLFNITKAKYGL